MAESSKIEWTDSTWNPIRARIREDASRMALQKGYASMQGLLLRVPAGKTGTHCEVVSPGCEHCWAQTHNSRCLPSNGTGLPYDRRARDLIDIYVDETMLAAPLRWREPRKIFVCSTTDLFGEFVPDAAVRAIFRVMAECPRHTFQILTKRAERMLEWAPAQNVWCGVSAENQEMADARIPWLLETRAAVRFVSYEPALGPVDFRKFASGATRLDWIIVGGESGHGARPFQLSWARETIRQCAASGIACFLKQLGAKPSGPDAIVLKDRKGGNWLEWPEELRVRQFPPA